MKFQFGFEYSVVSHCDFGQRFSGQDEYHPRAINGWAPNVIDLYTKVGSNDSVLNEDLGWLLRNPQYYIPIDLQVRKGSFGVFFHSLFLGLGGNREVIGPVELEWNDALYLFDVGLSDELGRSRLGEGSFAPEITVEPFLEARVVHQPVDISILGASPSGNLSSAAPVLGLRTFIDLTEHWNLTFHGDYGGFGVDDNHQTWQAVGLIGYRWKGWGVHWNLQAGYRAMRIFDLRREADIAMDARGADVVFAVEF